MKKFTLLLVLFCSFSIVQPQATSASDVCLSSFPDSAWSKGQPLEVSNFIQANSKDYAGGLSFYEWEYSPGNWAKYDELSQVFTDGADSQFLRGLVPTPYRFPFWFGAKEGDQIRATFVYTGRNCQSRTVLVNPIVKYFEKDFLLYETDYEAFLKSIARNFADESYYRKLIPKSTSIKLSTSQDGDKLIVGKRYFSNRFEISDLLPESLAESTLFNFADTCFSKQLNSDNRLKWWAGREGTFKRPGSCTATLIYYAKPQGRNLILYNYGTIEFTVLQNATAATKLEKVSTINCVKGKAVKKVTAVKPKCPSGYKLKK